MADQYYNNVQFALSLNGDFLDWSKHNRSVTIDSGIIMSNSVIKYGSYSAYFPAAVSRTMLIDYIDWTPNTDDYTIEFWINAIKASSPANVFLIGQYRDSNNFWKLYLNSINNDVILTSSSGTTITASNSFLNNWNTWNHVVMVRYNSITSIYINGAVVLTGNFTIPTINEPILIGGLQHSGTNEFFVGYLSDIRFTKGIARYTSNFNVPTQLLEQSSLKTVLIQTIDSISCINPQCNFDVYIVGSGKVKSFVSNSYGNIVIKVPEDVVVELTAYATGYKKARLEFKSCPDVVTLNLNRIVNSNSDTIQQLLPLIYFSCENDSNGILANSGITSGQMSLLNTNYITKLNSLIYGIYYQLSDTIELNPINNGWTGLNGLTDNTTGYQNITTTGGSYCFWVKPTKSIVIYNESITGNYADNLDQRFLITPEYSINNVFYGISIGINGIQFYMRKGTTFSPVLTWINDLSNWNHIVLTINSNGVPTLYMNGIFIKSTNYVPVGDRYLGLNIGTDTSGNRHSFAGSFTDMCLFGYDVSIPNINRIMNSQLKYKIQGKVVDSNGNVKPSIIRAYSHESGELIGECTTDIDGDYVLITSSNVASYVTCLQLDCDDISSEGMIYTNVIPSL